MNLAPAAIVAVPATLLVMGQTVQSVAQASDAMGRNPDDVAVRLRKAEYAIGGALVLASIVTGDAGTIAVTALTVVASYMVLDRLVLR